MTLSGPGGFVPPTTSAFEFEQQRDVTRLLRAMRRQPDVGEFGWTGRVDNTDLGFVDLEVEDVGDWDDWEEWE